MTYVTIFKAKIKSELSGHNGDKDFVDTLFDKIKKEINKVGLLLGLAEVDEETLKSYFVRAKNEYLSVNPIDPGLSHSLTKDGFKSWLDEARMKSIEWDYTKRYLTYLNITGRSNRVVDETERSSLSIVEKIADPLSQHSVFVKGLVVGAVQSGKTGNFNAVINRAIDSGYKLIIVLSGIMEDLRSQTQKRIELDVIGEGIDVDNPQKSGVKGVGKINRFGVAGNSSIIQVSSITSESKDFGKVIKELDFTLNAKYVLVCKKNVSVLRNLIFWLHNSLETDKKKHRIPLLLLDDEADNASLNNLGAKGRDYASRTNIQIRALLALFSVKTYLGYTATPFANVLQDRNDIPKDLYIEKDKAKGEVIEKELLVEGNIFPDDFIELLEPPSNYIGSKQIFETVTPMENNTDENEKIPLLGDVVSDYIEEFPSRVYTSGEGETIGVDNITSSQEWNERFGLGGLLHFNGYSEYKKETRAARKEDVFPKNLPESLKEAIKCFIISLAIRETRIPNMSNSNLFQPHNTMLVHVSRFTLWQNTTRDLIKEYIDDAISSINNDSPRFEGSIYHELEKVWYKNYAHIVEKIGDYLPKGYEDPYMVPVVFESIKNVLPEAIKGIEVLAINSFTKEKLEYSKVSPKKIIAVGGNRLSRGFTLEGLTINYFIRTTNYSDTLLQMGRWFGYRPGYLDCCKIFTTQDSLDKFNSTTKCIEELETEFKKMEERGKDPSSFVLRVKKHPGTLMITRPSILKSAREVKWSYQDQLEMTTKFDVTKEHLENVWNNFVKNITPNFNTLKDGLLCYQTSGAGIKDILQNQANNFDKDRVNQMSMFIELCNKQNLLNNWTVALKITGRSPREVNSEDINIFVPKVSKIQLAMRSGPNKKGDDENSFLRNKIYKASGKNANILSSNLDMSILLTDSQKDKAKESFYEFKARELQKKDKTLTRAEADLQVRKLKTIPERYYREQMTENQGLLIIYLFDSEYVFNQKGKNGVEPPLKEVFKKYIDDNDIDLSIPLVGYAIGFPPLGNDPGGCYMMGDYNLDNDEYNNEGHDDDTEMLNDLEDEL